MGFHWFHQQKSMALWTFVGIQWDTPGDCQPPTIRGWWWSWDMPCRTASEMRFFVKKKSWPPIIMVDFLIMEIIWKSTINKNPPFYINVWTLQNKSQIVPNQELKNTDPREKFWTIFPCLRHAYARRVYSLRGANWQNPCTKSLRGLTQVRVCLRQTRYDKAITENVKGGF